MNLLGDILVVAVGVAPDEGGTIGIAAAAGGSSVGADPDGVVPGFSNCWAFCNMEAMEAFADDPGSGAVKGDEDSPAKLSTERFWDVRKV